MSDFGTALKCQREQRGTSQSKLADRSGFDHSYISRLESGYRVPTRDAVHRLADALHATGEERDVLLAAAGFLPADPLSLFSADPTVTKVIGILTDPGLPDEWLQHFRNSIEQLAASSRFVRKGIAA